MATRSLLLAVLSAQAIAQQSAYGQCRYRRSGKRESITHATQVAVRDGQVRLAARLDLVARASTPTTTNVFPAMAALQVRR